MSYVIKSDYSRVISRQDLEDLLLEAAEEFQGKSSDQVRLDAEDQAETTIKSYLSIRFDMATEFAKDGSSAAGAASREKTILRCYLSLSVYFMQFVINPRDIPELREKDYDACLKTLQKAQKNELFLELTENATGDTARFVMDGNQKFRSKPFSDASLFENP